MFHGSDGRPSVAVRTFAPDPAPIAIPLAEAGWVNCCDLFGNDARAGAICVAKTAIFGELEIENVPPLLRRRYFIQHGRRCLLRRGLRSIPTWAVFDALLCEDASSVGTWFSAGMSPPIASRRPHAAFG
jgi:hypothetical protein